MVGMSGGVDSSVAAMLLLRQGYTVEGLFMKNWEDDDDDGYCAAAQDLEDAKAVCQQLEIPLHKVNFARDYWDRVFAHFLGEYEAGRTPNPDILCNKEIKFRAFLDYAITLGADAIATGHYARITKGREHYQLRAGVDTGKDQSYFLYTLGQKQLSKSLFPLGDMEKSKVREFATQAGLVTARKKDSTGICFIGERRFNAFLGRYLTAKPGAILSLDGDILATHQGLMFYTLGQRQGLGIGGLKQSCEKPWYVVGKDIANNTLIVAQGHDHPSLYHCTLQAVDPHWVCGHAPQDSFACQARIRYRQTLQDCHVSLLDINTLRVCFSHPQRAITPGQAVVFYQQDQCLGGGIITTVGDNV